MDYGQNTCNVSDNNAKNEGRSFSIAAMICGIVSVVLCCTGIFSIELGALSILFAVLSHRRGSRMSSMSITGIILSCIGMVLGAMLLLYSLSIVSTADQSPYGYHRSYEDLNRQNLDDLEKILEQYGLQE